MQSPGSYSFTNGCLWLWWPDPRRSVKCCGPARMKRFSAPNRHYPDPTCPPQGVDDDDDTASLSDGSKKVKTAQSFESLFDNESHSDVVLDVNDGQFTFHAHRMILGMKSEVFASLLNNVAAADGQTSTLRLREQQECARIFSRFLYFIYSGAVWLHRDYVIPLHRLAEKYAVRPLCSHCESYIQQLLSNTVSSPASSRGFAISVVHDLCENNNNSSSSSSMDEIKRLAFKVLCIRFKEFVRSDHWVNCSWNIVRDLIQSDDCNAEESFILTSATDWMKKNKLQAKGQIEDILSNIRYPLLNRRVLYHLQKNGAFKNFPCVQDLVDNAVKYHCFKDLPEAKDDFVGVQFEQRDNRLRGSQPEISNVAAASSVINNNNNNNNSSSTDCSVVQQLTKTGDPT